MSQLLPTGKFRWLTRPEIDNLDLEATSDDANQGYMLEVDLKYPSQLHDDHSDYPLASERLTIKEEMLSPFQKQHFPKEQKKTSIKLTPNLYDKETMWYTIVT